MAQPVHQQPKPSHGRRGLLAVLIPWEQTVHHGPPRDAVGQHPNDQGEAGPREHVELRLKYHRGCPYLAQDFAVGTKSPLLRRLRLRWL